MPPCVEVIIHFLIKVFKVVIFTVIVVIEGSMHEEVKFITAVEVTTSLTRARFKGGNNITNAETLIKDHLKVNIFWLYPTSVLHNSIIFNSVHATTSSELLVTLKVIWEFSIRGKVG